MMVTSTHWLIGAGLLDSKGMPFDAVTKKTMISKAKRSGRDIKRDREKIIGMLKDKKIMGKSTYDDLISNGFLTNGNEFLTYSRFASMCSDFRERDLGLDMETNTSKVMKLIEKGLDRKQIRVKLGLTSPQVSTAIRGLKVKGVI